MATIAQSRREPASVRLAARAQELLPRGNTLPAEIWLGRHRVITAILWLHVVGLFAFGRMDGFPTSHLVLEVAIIGVCATLANPGILGKRMSSLIDVKHRSVIASFGLLSASGILVHLSGGLIEAHFHFFVMVALVALYQQWTPFLLSIFYVLLHHGVLGVLDPQSVYNHPDAWAHPWKWAGIHALFVAAMSAVCIVGWRLNESLAAHGKKAEDELLASERRLQFLAEANAMLGSSLNYERTLADLASLAVPAVVDWCAVDLLDAAGDLKRVAVMHFDPDKVALAQTLLDRYPPPKDAKVGVWAAINSGETAFFPEISDDLLQKVAVDQDHLTILRSLDFCSALIVPLRARGRSLGAITYVTAESRRALEEEDRSMLEEVAHRAAIAIDNARLYRERGDIAQALQRSLLPPALPEIEGLALGARYVAAGESEVGGDFYDIFQTAANEWAIVMGDVCGKGPDAAALTGLVRSTVRAIAMQTRKPAAVLRALNQVLLSRDLEERFCTLNYLRLRLAYGACTVTVCSAGHPPPLIVDANHRVRHVGQPGSLLGQFEDVALVEAELTLSEGDRLVLLTDGVIEARGADGHMMDERLTGLLMNVQDLGPDELAELIQEQALKVQDGFPRDDIAVLVVTPAASRTIQLEPHGPKPMDLSFSLSADQQAASTARRFIRERLGWLEAGVREDLELLITELVTNSFRHSQMRESDLIEVGISVHEDMIRAEICDPGGGFEADPVMPSRLAESGRGLWIVQSLAKSWGIVATPPTCVWFEMKREPRGDSRRLPTRSEPARS